MIATDKEIVYRYHDATGAAKYEVIRYPNKTFRQRQLDGHGGHAWNLDGVERLPYRLPQLLKLKAKGHTIFVVEGEKDADRLASLGFCATTNAQGAGWKWTPAFVEHFRGGKRVPLLPDCDEIGRNAARLRAVALAAVCDDVRILDLAPDRDDGYDVSDWLDEGHTGEELKALVEATPRYVPEPGAIVDMTTTEVEWDDARPWPTLEETALYGLVGEIARAVDPHTEADSAAVLLTLLVGFGNAVGPRAHALVGDDYHPARLFVTLVGATSIGGKGTSLSAARPFLRSADSDWWSLAYVNGFASGEAIIARLSGAHREPQNEVPIEKRAFVVEPEFGRLLTVNGRDGSTSSPVLRGAWDDGRLQLIRSQKSMLAEDAHVSILAHVTPDELRAKLSSIEIADGFANRFLFACVKRSKPLPSPTPIDHVVLGAFAKRLRGAMDLARTRGVLSRSAEAESLWARLYYAEPERDGLVGEVTARWQAQKLRLSVVYALLDEASQIRAEHVVAAEAVWRFCVQSAEHVFGGMQGNEVADRVLHALRDVYPAGLDREQLRSLFSRHVRSVALTGSLERLEHRRLIRRERVLTGGAPREVSYAVPRCAKSAISTPLGLSALNAQSLTATVVDPSEVVRI